MTRQPSFWTFFSGKVTLTPNAEPPLPQPQPSTLPLDQKPNQHCPRLAHFGEMLSLTLFDFGPYSESKEREIVKHCMERNVGPWIRSEGKGQGSLHGTGERMQTE